MQETSFNLEQKASKKSTVKAKILRPLSVKQRKWADRKLKTGNGTQAALEVYDTKDYNTAAVIASENIKKPNVKQYLEDKAHRASERVFELAEQDKNLPVALGASKDILDRAGYKPVDKSVTINLEGQISKEERDRILGISLKVLEEMTHGEVNG